VLTREQASKIVDLAVRTLRDWNALLLELQVECSEEDFGAMRRGVGEFLGVLLGDLVNPLLVRFPELKPDGLDPPKRKP